jgi:hypothetical protein
MKNDIRSRGSTVLSLEIALSFFRISLNMNRLLTGQAADDDPEVAKEISRPASLQSEKGNEEKENEVVEVQSSPLADDFPKGGMQAWSTFFGAYVYRFVLKWADSLISFVRSLFQFATFG